MQCKTLCPLYPQKRTCAAQLEMSALGQKRTHAAQQKRSLFYNFVNAGKERWWHCEAKRLRGPEVDHQLDFRCLPDWQVRWPLALEDAAGVYASQTVEFRFIASIAHQAAGRDELAILVDCRHSVAE